MEERSAHLGVLIVVLCVGALAILTLCSTVLSSDSSVTGAVVKGKLATFCKDSDGVNPIHTGLVQVLLGSRFPDQCYSDVKTTKSPMNTGEYLREYVCEDNEVSYHVYDCGGVSSCQYGACASVEYHKVR